MSRKYINAIPCFWASCLVKRGGVLSIRTKPNRKEETIKCYQMIVVSNLYTRETGDIYLARVL